MKKTIAITLIVFFALATISIPRSLSQAPNLFEPERLPELLGYLLGAVVFPIAGLFFSVRWYLTLSGHTYKTTAQAWLYILRPYALLASFLIAVVLLIRAKANITALIGVLTTAFWAWSVYASTKWLKRLHVLEAAGTSAVDSSAEERSHPAPYIVVVLLSLLVGIGSVYYNSLPGVRLGQADRELKTIPFFRAISEVDPLTYQKMLALTVDGMGKGESIDTISSKVVPILSETIPKYTGTASDESVIALIDVVVRRVEALHSAHSDACYYYLFPNENGAPLPSSYSDDKTNADSLAAMGSIVQSAVHSPQPPPDAAKAQTLLVPVFKRLRDAYGDDLRLLKQKPVDSAGRQRVCDISISLYRNVESLPNGDAGMVLRYLLSDQTSTTEARSSRR